MLFHTHHAVIHSRTMNHAICLTQVRHGGGFTPTMLSPKEPSSTPFATAGTDAEDADGSHTYPGRHAAGKLVCGEK